MNAFLFVLKIIFGLFFSYAGIMHFMKPQFFKHFIPSFLPKLAMNYIFGGIEIALGVALFFTQTDKEAAAGIFILMLLFLPIHIWDVFSETPAIGSHNAALIRLPIQFLLIFIAWKVVKNDVS